MPDLEHEWAGLWERIGAKGEYVGGVYTILYGRYSEPHRKFHNLQHIEHCLEEYMPVRRFLDYPDELEFALWFHDIVYDTNAKDNEERSAEMAYDVAIGAGMSERFANRVYSLVMVTKHSSLPEVKDEQFMADIDLSGMGRLEEEYDKVERAIREEYKEIPDGVFKPGRSAILRRFLGRPHIYSTGFFRQKYEEQARRNMERAIVNLR